MKKNTLSPKSIIAILIAAIIALTAFVPVSAYGGRVYVADETDSIPAKDLAKLNEYAEHASEACGTDILFLLAEDEAAAGDSIVDYMANYPNMGNGESRIFFAIGPDSTWYILCGGNMQNMLYDSAAFILFIIPLIVLYLFTQKGFVQSIERSGLVG